MGKLSAMLLASILAAIFTVGLDAQKAESLGSLDVVILDKKNREERVLIRGQEQKTYMSLHDYVKQKESGAGEIIEYKVKSGDSISSIAREHKIEVSTILYNNRIANKHLIKPGQKLTFPTVNGYIYTVSEDSHIAKVAKQFNVDIESVIRTNNLESDKLEVGTKLILPEFSPSSTRLVSRGGSRETLKWPVSGAITSSYGYRMHPIRKVNSFHRGIDIGASRGTPILAAASGEVVYSGYRNSYGNTIILQHEDSFTLYAHAHQLKVEKGQWVNRGEVIATVGSTGMATGPHLHFEVRIDGNRSENTVDPKKFLP
ncbi:M23 family metallopeptidase [Proteinivorax hydrogeniformans]|uniref:M23 family metallopeptidase n=1 Tax=Proteinivorax hydrogeniformans TaxID=1826727 RepID=A0AAU8HSV1_9FIRM